jgi:t-SNARE complex subunit (syntaxin)
MYNIKTYFTELDKLSEEQDENIETTDLNTKLDGDIIAARQHTFMWDEEKCLNIASGMNKKNVTCYNQMIVAIVGMLTVIIRKYKNKRC